MGIEQFLTHEDKLESLAALREMMDAQLSLLCTEMGILRNEESINLLMSTKKPNSDNYRKTVLIFNLFNNLKKLDEKIEEIK
jgi:hypothetical protein